MSFTFTWLRRVAPVALVFAAACSGVEDVDDDHHHDHNHGVTTTLKLVLTPAGGDAVTYTWADPEDDGSPVIDDIVLTDGLDTTYTVDVEVWNELEDPAEDVTPEIAELGTEHQLFFTGDAVEGPATGPNAGALLVHSYSDADVDGNPIGLANEFVATAAGTGELVVTLRHLAYENDQPTKSAGLAEDVANGGFGSIPGDIDIQVTFPVEVQ